MPAEIVYEDRYYRIEHVDSPIAGYLVVRARPAATHLTDLPAPALTALGPLLARASAIVEEWVQPERVYVVRFGEEVEQIHFHIFPRTRAMRELYHQTFPDTAGKPINAARLIDWIRTAEAHSRLGSDQDREKNVSAIRRAFQTLTTSS